ncbi:hypothetical protein DYP60_03880 [Sphaerochaeta halotolerans]|uniref:Uncharacterized protein n=1 Tax=Sphaerochaeta halotolerans TaxID=2293840 RepID=A0A372MJK2_9SPIR|nr:hypothetical protein DYP60_03880 [Sphaerochaeta halotolerans]
MPYLLNKGSNAPYRNSSGDASNTAIIPTTKSKGLESIRSYQTGNSAHVFLSRFMGHPLFL